MPKYFYTARSLKGESKSGTLEARDKHELAYLLHQQGYLLVSAVLEQDKKKSFIVFFRKWLSILPFLGRVRLKEKMFFTRNLRVMISAGLPLPRSLKTLAGQTKSKKLKSALLDVNEGVIRGETFSQGLSRHPDIFSELYQNMIKVGEEAGTLEDILKVLTEQMEKEAELKSKIIGAMIYPAVIIVAMLGVGILMLIVVVPQLAQTFEELGIELPITTRFVVFLGIFLTEKWYLFILGATILLILFRAALKSNFGRKLLGRISLRTPIISGIIRKVNSASTARTLSSLIVAGVPIVRSLEIISRALGNAYFKKAVKEAAEKVRKGEKLYEALKPHEGLYPSLVLEMIEIGEETGETSSILTKLADFYEEEVANATKNLSAIIEPLLMLLIGAAVGFFAVSMIQPMYAMLGAF